MKNASFIERVIQAAQAHGDAGDPDMEVGDLQGLAHDLWNALTAAQKSAFAARPDYRSLIKDWSQS